MRGRKDGSGEPLNKLVSVETNTILYKNTNMPFNSAITDTKRQKKLFV